MNIPILNALKENTKIDAFAPHMLDQNGQVEKRFPHTENFNFTGYNMEEFLKDNQLVMQWFAQLQQEFNQWLSKQRQLENVSVTLAATGSRSFNASYTESDLECAIVSESFDDFVDFCRFLNTRYANGHNFVALKTLAGLPLLIIKSESGFSCPKLAELYPGKTLSQLEITFRHPKVHDIIQKAGTSFFEKLTSEELTSYVFNKRYIELMSRNIPKDAKVEDKTLKSILEEFKGTLAAALKCLPPGKLQDTPDFNKEVFATIIKQPTMIADSVSAGLLMYKTSGTDKPTAAVNTQEQPCPKY